MPIIEVEVKSLPTPEQVQALKAELTPYQTGEESQLNHYFAIADIAEFRHAFTWLALGRAIPDLMDISVRTRLVNGSITYLIIKGKLPNGGTAENGVARSEYTYWLDRPIDWLDDLLLQSGCKIQSKWSRHRVIYAHSGLTICLDKNAGYGHLIEVEKEVESEAEVPAAQEQVRNWMRDRGLIELPSDRLERMFAHYNANWPQFYGTENTFEVL